MLSFQSLGAGTAKPAPSFKDFTNTFVLSPGTSSKDVLSEIPKSLEIDPFRQRRIHKKSRAGCENCKRRRVKCNEEKPCGSCKHRGERCRRHTRGGEETPISPMPTQPLLSNSRSTDAVVNLLHLELFHHFQTCTRQTLLFTPEVWGHAIQLSFKFEFLMGTILCVAARHLAVLRPENTTYSTAAANHLCHALSLFRHELTNNFNSTHFDAFIATSLLLQYETWASTDVPSNLGNDLVSLNPAEDRLFAMSSSLKQVFLKSVPLICDQPSVFMPQVRYNPADKLIAAAQISSDTLAKFRDCFSYHCPLGLEKLNVPVPFTRSLDSAMSNSLQSGLAKGGDPSDPIEDGYVPTVTRLCLVLSFLPEAQPPDFSGTSSTLFPDLARYILLFPIACHGPFASMIQARDPKALLLLYHFYRAARILLPPEEYWWAHNRATSSEAELKQWLTKRCATQADT